MMNIANGIGRMLQQNHFLWVEYREHWVDVPQIGKQTSGSCPHCAGGTGKCEQVHPASIWHVSEHPSPFFVLPSSHFSPPESFESPHSVGEHTDEVVSVAPGQEKPHSTRQSWEQPSPDSVFPSSHSFLSFTSSETVPTPQTPSKHVLGAG